MKKNLLAIAIMLSAFSCFVKTEASDITIEANTIIKDKTTTAYINQINDNLTIENNVKFQNNSSSSHAGAIFNNGKLVGNGVIFEKNKANKLAGAIANNNDLSISNSTFTENSANIDGGAIFNANTATINGSTFNKNTANRHAGAIFNQSTLTVNNSTFTENQASQFGGAICNLVNTTIKNSTFTKNASENHGGAILNNRILDVENSTFTENHANKLGGAICNLVNATIKNSTFNQNDSGSSGGSIFNQGEITLDTNTFINNSSNTNGGAVYNTKKLTIENSVFKNNIANLNGGGVLSTVNTTNTINNSIFENNTAKYDGGAIWTEGGLTLTNSTFQNNKAVDGEDGNGYAGAILIQKNLTGDINIDSTKFISNEADYGGALYTKVSNENSKKVTITNSYFEGNKAKSIGAVGSFLRGTSTTMEISNTIFKNNEATDPNDEGGGALFVGSESKTKLTNVTFDGNKSASVGGSIASRVCKNADGTKNNNIDGILQIYNSTFKNNSAKTNGGALDNHFYHADNIIKDSIFENNTAKNGGAFYNNNIDDASSNFPILRIVNSTLTGNTASENGGGIYNSSTQANALNITDTSFINNSATNKGGAIYSVGDINLEAKNKNIEFKNNKATDGNDIYMATTNSNINMQISNGKSIISGSGISGTNSKYNINVNGAGTFDVSETVKNAIINVNDTSTLWLRKGQELTGLNNKINFADGTTLNTINNKIETFESGLFNPQGNLIIKADVDVNTGVGDNIGGAITDAPASSSVTIKEINSVASNATSNNINIDIYKALGLNKETTQLEPENIIVGDVMTPIRNLHGSISEDGIIHYTPTGNSYNDFNSAIMASSVAAQLGGYLTQLNTYDEAFRNMDMYMLMTKSQRKAIKNANKYAASNSELIFNPIITPYNGQAGYLRPYAYFESVRLKNGPKVSNVAYGTFGGVDSGIHELGNGWDGMLSIYAGYNGSHQAYQGNSIYQNGGSLGITGYVYKDNFFTGLTANIGSNIGDIDTKYGSEDFTMLMTGIAAKSGCNYEFADGKFIIQPSMLMSYSMINTFDYTNAAGVRMNHDPLHAIQLEPALKFIGNLPNGWQPYAGVSVVWNIMDNTQVKANDISLPDLSIKPFVKYGVGVKKTWGERFTGFLQTFLTSGGRDGIGIQGGFRWRIGK